MSNTLCQKPALRRGSPMTGGNGQAQASHARGSVDITARNAVCNGRTPALAGRMTVLANRTTVLLQKTDVPVRRNAIPANKSGVPAWKNEALARKSGVLMRVRAILSGRNMHPVADRCRPACVQWLVFRKSSGIQGIQRKIREPVGLMAYKERRFVGCLYLMNARSGFEQLFAAGDVQCEQDTKQNVEDRKDADSLRASYSHREHDVNCPAADDYRPT